MDYLQFGGTTFRYIHVSYSIMCIGIHAQVAPVESGKERWDCLDMALHITITRKPGSESQPWVRYCIAREEEGAFRSQPEEMRLRNRCPASLRGSTRFVQYAILKPHGMTALESEIVGTQRKSSRCIGIPPPDFAMRALRRVPQLRRSSPEFFPHFQSCLI